MSELKVNKLSPESGTTLTLGDAGDTIVNNGTASGFLPTAGSSGNVLTSDGTNWASTAAAGGGKLLQAVTYESTSTSTTTSSSWTDTTMVVTITPSATSSKILLLLTTNMSNANAGFAALTIFRGNVSSGQEASAINNTATYGFQAVRDHSATSYYNDGMNVSVLDAPATTSAQLYTVAIKSESGNQIGINYGAGNSSLIAMEIGA